MKSTEKRISKKIFNKQKQLHVNHFYEWMLKIKNQYISDNEKMVIAFDKVAL